MKKAQLFLNLQNKVNSEIDQFGIATIESVDALEKLGNELTADEIDEVCELYLKLGQFLVQDLPNNRNR